MPIREKFQIAGILELGRTVTKDREFKLHTKVIGKSGLIFVHDARLVLWDLRGDGVDRLALFEDGNEKATTVLEGHEIDGLQIPCRFPGVRRTLSIKP